MKLQSLIFFLLAAFFLFSCSKELSYENTLPGGNGGTSAFTFSDGSGNCTSAVISGIYKTGTALSGSNTIELVVNVVSAGTYTISTSTVNGISFSGSGTFSGTGTQVVTLTGSGTPTAAGTFSYKAGSNGCSFNIIVTDASTPPAVFTYDGGTGSCTGAIVAGNFKAGLAVTASNKVTLKVNVTTAGTYNVTTTEVNGVSFSASGTFTNTGSQALVLNPTGTPTAAGDFNYTPTNGCQFTITVAAPPAPAVFTLAGAPGACTGAVIGGAYTTNATLTTSNTATIKVDVTSVGSYNIVTNAVNGMTFFASGEFAATGQQDVVLVGTGKPTAAGTFTINPQVGSSGCTFDITVTQPIVDPGIYSCKIDGVLTNFTDRATADNFDEIFNQYELGLDGYAGPPNGGTVPRLQMFITNNDGSAIKAGTYNEKALALFPGGYRIEIDFTEELTDGTTIIWNTASNFLPPDNPPFTIIITSITATRVKGTFSGKLHDILHPDNTTIRTVTEGTFDLPIQ